MTNAVISTGEAAAYLGLHCNTLEKWRVSGRGPVFLRLGRAIRYRVTDLDSFLTSNAAQSTSERAAA